MGRFSDLAEQITGITTPPDEPVLRPNWAGSFVSHGDWVNRATRVLVHNAPLCRTTGNPLSAMCVDALGRRCSIGADFSRARDEGAFPVYFFFDCVAENTGRLTDFVPPPSFAESKRAGSAMTLICRDDNGQEHRFDCANGFVTRVVSAIFHSDNMGCYSDAHRVMEIMNAEARVDCRNELAQANGETP